MQFIELNMYWSFYFQQFAMQRSSGMSHALFIRELQVSKLHPKNCPICRKKLQKLDVSTRWLYKSIP